MKKNINLRNRSPCIHQFIFIKSAKVIQKRKDSVFNRWLLYKGYIYTHTYTYLNLKFPSIQKFKS